MSTRKEIKEGDLLWQPTADDIANANITRYINWLNENRGTEFQTYADLWTWSVTEIEPFWSSLFDFFDLVYSGTLDRPLALRDMPGASWFEEVTLNYAENIFAKGTAERPAFYYKGEDLPLTEIGWPEIESKTAAMAAYLRDLGVKKGDRVVAYMPHIPETIIAFFAAASLGAIWSSCSPDFGSRSVLDRFQQIEPTVLIAVDGYNYGGKTFERTAVVQELQAGLPTLKKTVIVSHVGSSAEPFTAAVTWDEALSAVQNPGPLTFERVEFGHPMWVLYSSGTTGLPKPIVHSQGGVLLEHVKSTAFHNDLKPTDRFFWYSSTGWMMWNYTVGALLSGCSIIIYNGSPGYPDMNGTFQLAEESGMTYLGTSAAFISACMKADIAPSRDFDLSKIRALGSTGSPLTVSGFQWIYENVNPTLALESLSGGTDLCTAFVGGARTLPIYAGEIQGASLGAKVEAWNDAGEPVIDEVGELVIAEPMPSMPLFFWNDPEMARYKSSYFEMFPGKWRHGDWIKFNERGGCVIYGRSDSTINRQGIRMGTSEIYQAVESLDEIMDSLIIDLEFHGRDSFMPLFVVMRDGVPLDDEVKGKIKSILRQKVSPRHVPNEILEIKEVPYTLSGKKMEVPIRKILLGLDTEKAANPGAMRNPGSIRYFIEYAKSVG